jgi:DNA-binding MarR family transcriptional regulator
LSPRGAQGSTSPGPGDSPGFLLWRATLRWQRSITVALRPVELTHVQFVLLASVWWLSDHREPGGWLPSQRQVADHAEVDVMMTSQVLRALEGRGLVTRTMDPDDARVKRLTVTEKGQDLATRAITIVDIADADFFTRAHDRGQLLDVLHQLAHGPPPPAPAGHRRAPNDH